MFYLLHGTDLKKVQTKSQELQESLIKKKPNASIFRFNAESWNEEAFDELVKSQGLFETKYIIVLDRVFENVLAKDFILKALKDLKASSHVFILIQGKLDKATLTRIEKQAEKVQVFGTDPSTKLGAGKFNIFSLTFPLEHRDKRKLWILYQTARKNAVPEEIHGILWWKIKNMILSGRSGSYSADELKTIASNLVSIYHNAHRGLFDFDLALEKWILEI